MVDPTFGAITGATVLGIGASAMGAKEQSKANKSAQEMQWQMYLQNREDMTPWREVGAESLAELQGVIASGPGQFEASPGYQFRLGEGLRALDMSAAKRGTLQSGDHMRALTRYGQDYATNDYNNFINRWLTTKVNPLASLANTGQVQSRAMANMGANTANQMADLALAQGSNRASMYNNFANTATWGMGQMGQAGYLGAPKTQGFWG